MHTFLCSSGEVAHDRITVTDAARLRHMRDVLRIRKGEKVDTFDEQGTVYRTVVEEVGRDRIVLAINERKQGSRDAGQARLTVACALPKNVKMDDIVDKLTQLGVDTIIPMLTERVIVRWDGRKKESHRQRWERIALSACEQSRRSSVPVIEAVQEFQAVAARAGDYDLAIIPWLEGKRKTLKEVLCAHPANTILVMIGPEGDFSAEEVSSALAAGCVPVSLGERVLRVDTACAAVAAFIRLYGER